ncbi:MAG: hypothetical protein A2189_05780 [Paenibacillus sp. RIFOXYA1_FULL_44_5]|nr:MAG: hypothetical protein A2189_05780 [Paenibacillus sp. RIFOXYA1_FULL_44_5]
MLHVILAITPAMALGLATHKYITKYLFSPMTVLIGLVIGGVFMMIAEWQKPKKAIETMDELTYKQAIYIGLAQCLSLWPGFSRSGATIAGGMLSGASRAAAADFSFLIAIPVMIAATGYELLKTYKELTSSDFVFFAVGFIISFIVALLAVVTFIKLVQKLKLTYFAYYRFILAILFLLYMIFVGIE